MNRRWMAPAGLAALLGPGAALAHGSDFALGGLGLHLHPSALGLLLAGLALGLAMAAFGVARMLSRGRAKHSA